MTNGQAPVFNLEDLPPTFLYSSFYTAAHPATPDRQAVLPLLEQFNEVHISQSSLTKFRRNILVNLSDESVVPAIKAAIAPVGWDIEKVQKSAPIGLTIWDIPLSSGPQDDPAP